MLLDFIIVWRNGKQYFENDVICDYTLYTNALLVKTKFRQ